MLLAHWLVGLKMDVAHDTTAAGAGNGGAAAATITQAATPASGAATPTGPPGTPPVAQPAQYSAEQTQALATAILQHVAPQIEAAVAPVRQQVQAFGQQLTTLAQPQRQASQLFGGGAPGIRMGENPLTSRGFQYQRLAGYMQGFQGFTRDNCQVELQFCQDLEAAYTQNGFTKAGARTAHGDSILVPLSATLIPDQIQSVLTQKFGNIGQFFAQGVSGIDPDQMRHMCQSAGMSPNRITQALSILDDANGGALVGPAGFGELIAFIRPREALSRLGVTDVQLPPSGHLRNAKITGSTTGYWVGENTPITASQPTTGASSMTAKKMACLLTTSNEMLRFTNPGSEFLFRSEMGSCLALLGDRAGISGAGTTTQPKGLLNYAGILNHTATMTIGANGNTFMPKTPGAMIADVGEQNFDTDADGFAFAMREKMLFNIGERRADTVTAGDQAGSYLFSMNRNDMNNGLPAVLRGKSVVTSGNLPADRAKGSSSVLSTVIGGIWKHLLRGRIGVIEFAMATQGDTIFAADQSSLRAIDFIDFLPRYENCFVKADYVDMDLPA